MGKQKLDNKLILIAGPCSLEKRNLKDIYRIAEIKISKKQKAVYGTRVVGLKSRTLFNKNGEGMGIDYKIFMDNLDRLFQGDLMSRLKILPSITIAKKIIKETNMLVATEIMSPLLQLPLFERVIPKNKLLIWNPAVNQLGWPVLKMAHYAIKNDWYVGLKNGKWWNMEKTWLGLMHYASSHDKRMKKKIVFIQRGINILEKGHYRSLPVHDAALRIKAKTRGRIYFDPSHSLGPKLRHQIADAVVEAMKIRFDEKTYLYDGILIEVGHSYTDTKQHLSIEEFEELCYRLAEFRTLIPPQ